MMGSRALGSDEQIVDLWVNVEEVAPSPAVAGSTFSLREAPPGPNPPSPTMTARQLHDNDAPPPLPVTTATAAKAEELARVAEEHIVALCNNVDEVVPSPAVAGPTFELREMPPRTAPPPIPPVSEVVEKAPANSVNSEVVG